MPESTVVIQSNGEHTLNSSVFSNVDLSRTTKSANGFGWGAVQTRVEGDKWDLENAVASFIFAGACSVVGVFCKQLSSILFGIGFSISEYVLNKLLEWIDINKKQSFIIQGDNV